MDRERTGPTITAVAPLALARQFAAGYWQLLPGAFLTWAFVEVAAPRATPHGDPLLVIPFFLLGAAPLMAAAARTVGLSARPLLALTWERMNAFLLAGVVYWLAACAYVALWAGLLVLVFGRTDDWGSAAEVCLWSVVLLTAWLLARSWPAVAAPFLYRGRLLDGHRGPSWLGPGLGCAFRMTGRSGALLRATLPVAVLAIVPLWLLVEARGLAPPALSGCLAFLCYFVALPWAAVVVVERAAALRLEAIAWIEVGEPSEDAIAWRVTAPSRIDDPAP